MQTLLKWNWGHNFVYYFLYLIVSFQILQKHGFKDYICHCINVAYRMGKFLLFLIAWFMWAINPTHIHIRAHTWTHSDDRLFLSCKTQFPYHKFKKKKKNTEVKELTFNLSPAITFKHTSSQAMYTHHIPFFNAKIFFSFNMYK